MKKILFATTALVATAGVASAEVSISGSGTFGVYDSDTLANAVLKSSVDLTFTGTTETDGGVKLTAIANLENFGTSNTYVKDTDETSVTVIMVQSGGLTFAYGNTDGALDKNTTELHRLPGIDFELWGVGVDNVDNGAIARLDYSIGDFAVSLSWAGTDEAFGIGAKYSADLGSAKVDFGAGYEDGNLGDSWAISAGTSFGAFSVRANYGEGSEFLERWGVSAQYSANGLTVGANYHEVNNEDGYTVFGSYDLGGGAALFAQHGEVANAANEKRSALGVRFSF